MNVSDLIDLLLGELAVEYPEGSDVRLTFVPGQLKVDDWCWNHCGQVYLRLDAMFESPSFPSPNTSTAVGSMPLAARFHVGVARCLAGPDAEGNPPPPAEQAADAAQLTDDACKLLAALRRASATLGRGASLLGAWTPQGPLGNCGGGYWPWTGRVT